LRETYRQDTVDLLCSTLIDSNHSTNHIARNVHNSPRHITAKWTIQFPQFTQPQTPNSPCVWGVYTGQNAMPI